MTSVEVKETCPDPGEIISSFLSGRSQILRLSQYLLIGSELLHCKVHIRAETKIPYQVLPYNLQYLGFKTNCLVEDRVF